MSAPEQSDEERIAECLAGVGSSIHDTFAVTNWVVVMERIAVDGTRVLMRLSSSDTTGWTRDGMLHSALYGFPDDDGEDD